MFRCWDYGSESFELHLCSFELKSLELSVEKFLVFDQLNRNRALLSVQEVVLRPRNILYI